MASASGRLFEKGAKAQFFFSEDVQPCIFVSTRGAKWTRVFSEEGFIFPARQPQGSPTLAHTFPTGAIQMTPNTIAGLKDMLTVRLTGLTKK